MKKTFVLILFIFVFGLSLNYLQAYPRFAAYTGDKCMDCHVDPTGGTMRNSGGTGYAKSNLNMDMFKKIAGKTQFSPKITKDISVGGDVRVAQVDNEVEGAANYNSFLAMQGDLYLNAQLSKIVSVFITSGLEIPGIEADYEVYGMISNLPANTYFKVGVYKPNYGIKIVEHRAYQRKYLWNAPYNNNTGFELGISPEWFSMNIGLYNPMDLDFLGRDPHKMFVANTDANFGFSNNNFNVNVGASFFNNPHNTRDTSGTQTITAVNQAYGGYTRIGVIKRIAFLGEIDFQENTSDRPLRRSLFGYAELNFLAIKGVELRSQYEYYDINRDITGDHIQRISGGVGLFPFYGFETELMVRFPIEDPEKKNNEFQWNFHFYF
ncbi:MAG: hypothetical protein R2942_04450 [Ignavibacteria bacterium]|nr:hypothetical protein [Ignavibacteriota bacterium]